MKTTQYSNYNKAFILFLFLLIVNKEAFGQSLVTIPNTLELPLKSNTNNQSYNLHIALPHGYEKSEESYPTIYLLDANNDFPLVTSISRRLEAEDNLKKFIIVGISYQDSVWFNRSKDYTPSREQGRNYTGGASDFATVIEKEIIPLIEKHIRVKKESRTLLGHSLGGLFGSYLLLEGNTLFDSYILSSPSLWWDDYYLFKNTKTSFPESSIFLSVGAIENPHMIEGANRLSKFIDEKIASSAKKLVLLDGENHASSKIRAYTDGMRWLFKGDNQ